MWKFWGHFGVIKPVLSSLFMRVNPVIALTNGPRSTNVHTVFSSPVIKGKLEVGENSERDDRMFTEGYFQSLLFSDFKKTWKVHLLVKCDRLWGSATSVVASAVDFSASKGKPDRRLVIFSCSAWVWGKFIWGGNPGILLTVVGAFDIWRAEI